MNIHGAQERFIERIAKDWALLTVGNMDDFNTMTIAWGEAGTMWWKKVVSVYVTPRRYTHHYLCEEEYFTISMFPRAFRDDMMLLGTKSGRNCDKVAMTSLTPIPAAYGATTFKQAEFTIVCRKLFQQPLDPDALPEWVIKEHCRSKGVHEHFMGEIVAVQ